VRTVGEMPAFSDRCCEKKPQRYSNSLAIEDEISPFRRNDRSAYNLIAVIEGRVARPALRDIIEWTPMTRDTADFGFKDVPREEKARRVKGVFDSVADRYDLMNDLCQAGRTGFGSSLRCH